jgi:polyamine oxidase
MPETEWEDRYARCSCRSFGDLVDAMATGVDLRLGVDVVEVALSAGGVRVQGADGTTEEGSHVVVAVPLGVLKRGAPRFSPRAAA